MTIITFPDGVMISAVDATKALLAIGGFQFKPTYDLAHIKAVLADRAWNWSHARVDPDLDDTAFLQRLHAVKFLTLATL